MNVTIRKVLAQSSAPILAVISAALVCSLVLLGSGANPLKVYALMIDYGTSPSSIVAIVDKWSVFFLAGIAGAIGFKMLLFNIGIDGQYRMATFTAAVVGGAVVLPAPLHIALVIVTGMLVGGLWAAIAGWLKVKRGVSEVISTIMLNAIATGLIAYLLNPARLGHQAEGSNNISTKKFAESAHLPGIPFLGGEIYGMTVVAILAGVVYWVVLNRTRFGFDLRASGLSLRAAQVSGVSSRRMILVTIVVSGAVAGLVGMPQLIGGSHAYTLDFPAGYGLAGLAIALLGRNHPVGVAAAAFLWAFIERSGQILDINNVPKEIVTIMQGTIVICVVVAYEIVRRFESRQQHRAAGRAERAAEQKVVAA